MSRFLFATMPIPGHVAPIAPVVSRLVERGHEVVWYGSSFFQAAIERSGARFSPIRSAIDFGDNDYEKHFPGRSQHSGLRQVVFDFEHAFVGSVEGYVTDLRAIIADFAPDALVTDPAVAAGTLLSIVDNIPTATINITVLALPSRDLAPFGPGVPPLGGRLGRFRNAALGFLINHVAFRPVNRAYQRLARRHGWPLMLFRPDATRFLYLHPGVPELEYPRSDLPPQVHHIGALLPDPATDFDPPDWWDAMLAARAAGTKVVLVTQGTIATDPTELINPTIEALTYEDVFVIAACGTDPATVVVRHDNAHVVQFVPFAQVMPFVDAYVTNGGYGGVVIALTHGVPIVTAGTTEDKAEVGGRVSHAGVGINLRTSRPTVRKLRDAVVAVLTEPRYRERAESVRDAFATHDALTEAATLLERLAETKEPVLR